MGVSQRRPHISVVVAEQSDKPVVFYLALGASKQLLSIRAQLAFR